MGMNITKPCSLQKVPVMVTYNSCSSLVELSYCSGPCMSSSMYVLATQSMAHKCSCCREVVMNRKQISLRCPDGSYINYTVNTVAQCDCVTASCVT
ncbi:hypothetical protein NDU88_003767 [Pleurodeles waltl]|uniref:CTCK domain-containing protein n=1 Tax=Pleurodeles waltl TaxID=8319 RepID=A0AAV7TQH9_PLEWA|nr:hypothetical protein NDU88_003767 [Pleurodeles waltl]